MKKNKLMSCALCCLLFTAVFHITVSANSSWGWIAETRPYDVLPYVIIITLAIETLAINKIPKICKPFKVFCVVTIANLLSFAAPYLFWYSAAVSDQMYTFIETIEHMPVYNVGMSYLIITLAVEVPIVYNAFKKSAQKEKLLLWTVIGTNVATTIIVGIIERIICPGSW
ncbi:MAG: hypothetical protein AAGU14_08460 [Eubacteriaceae bacterium]